MGANADAERLRGIFSANLNRHMVKKQKTISDLSNELNISFSTVADWVHGRKMPRIDKIEMLADYFDVLKSDLIEEKLATDNDDELLMAIFKDERKSALAKWIAGLDDRGLDRIEKLLDAVEMLPKE